MKVLVSCVDVPGDWSVSAVVFQCLPCREAGVEETLGVDCEKEIARV